MYATIEDELKAYLATIRTETISQSIYHKTVTISHPSCCWMTSKQETELTTTTHTHTRLMVIGMGRGQRQQHHHHHQWQCVRTRTIEYICTIKIHFPQVLYSRCAAMRYLFFGAAKTVRPSVRPSVLELTCRQGRQHIHWGWHVR